MKIYIVCQPDGILGNSIPQCHFQQNFTYVFKQTNKEIQSYLTYACLQHSFVGITPWHVNHQTYI